MILHNFLGDGSSLQGTFATMALDSDYTACVFLP